MLKGNSFIGGIILLIAALHSGYALLPVYPSHLLIIVAITTGLMFFIVRTFNINTRLICFLIFIFVFGYASAVDSIVNLTALIKLQLVVIFSYLFVNYLDYKKFVRLYIYFMLTIASGSLSLYFIANFTNLGIVDRLPIFVNDNGMGYHNGLFLFLFESEYIQYRNTGFFWEPGIFSSYLSLAILLSGHIKLVRDKVITFILTLTIFTTYSTGGYILLILALMAKYFKGAKGKYFFIMFISLVLISISAFYAEFIELVRSYFPEVTNKFFVEGSDSILHRIKSPTINIEAFLKKPFIGLGLNEVNELYKVKGNFSQSSTMTYYLGAFGFFGIFYSYLILYGTVFSKSIYFRGLSGTLSFLIMIIILNKEPHMYFCLTYIILFYWVLEAKIEYKNRG